MLLSRNWLTKFLDLKKVTNQEISVALNSLGFEVEQEQDFSQLNDELVIGYVQESEPIPNTHLRFNLVDIGHRQLLKIVCGADNVQTGQYVIVAQVGQTIANGLTLEKRKIRGYDSEGMICALNEIGIKPQFLTPVENDSIYVITANQNLKPLIGRPISNLGYDDYLWDIDLTLNRSDALAAHQLVKEIANYFHLTITQVSEQKVHHKLVKTTSEFQLTIDQSLEKKLNTLSWTQIELSQGLTQLWAVDDLLLKRLAIKTTQSGIEDLSLISAWETGQPFIVLDQEKVGQELSLTTIEDDGKKLVVLKKQKEIVQTLGLSTAQDFQVGPQTQKVLVIMVNLTPELMRQQQKNLAQSSINLQRYMKPLNPNLYSLGIRAYLQWLENYQVLKSWTEVQVLKEKVQPVTKHEITLTKVQTLLGMPISVSEIKNLFSTLDFKVTNQGEKLIFTIDSNRTDIFGENDLVEEIARIYGYDHLPSIPPVMVSQVQKINFQQRWQQKIQNYLLGVGFQNIKTYSLLSQKKVKHWNLFDLTDPIQLQSPLSQLHETYRLSLTPSIIETAIFNVANNNKQLKLWEVADVYTHDQRQRHLALLVTGPILNEPLIHQTIANSYFYLKGLIEAILRFYKIDNNQVDFQLMPEPLTEIHPFINAQILIQKQKVGFIFRLQPKFENEQKLSPTYVAELNLDLFAQFAQKDYSIQPLSKFQSSTRDLSLVVPATLSYKKMVHQLIKEVQLVTDVRVIDQYQDEKMVEQNQQSLTISFTFNNLKKQMNENNIQQQWNQVLKNAQSLGLTIR